MSWPMVKLAEVCQINPRLPKGADEEQEVSFLAMASISEEGQILTQESRILGETKKGFTYFEKGDVIVAKITPCFENGKAAFLDGLNTQIGFGSTEFHVLRPNEGQLDGKYLFYLLWNDKFRFVAERNMSGSAGQKRVPTDFFKKHEIPLPPLDEQKRIAAILDKADAIRQKRKQAIALADDFLRSVFLDMFGDPVTNSKGWESKKLGDLCGVGSSKRVFVNEFVDSGIPFYRGTEVGKLGNDETIESNLFISEEHYHALKKHGGVPQLGDLLLPSICPDGRIWLVNHQNPFYFKDGRVLWIKSSQTPVSSDYIRSFLQRMFFANYDSIASGTTFAELKIVALKNMDILLPPESLQIEYSQIMEKAISHISKQLTAIQEQTRLFNSLSQKAFSGQL
ncbi:restriction endonuclease subunit S [Photobacterium leiognathi]|uniref:restriction endonuclease subunit S n=1 Tax=Photobacterium leiognathi TaxID=553611 RepID=UPI0027364369|nr:restriction endonuclease subunit S [Photobacterium leiognathi]